MTGMPRVWGATADEAQAWFRADDEFGADAERLTRAVTVHAPADLVYRWLCQVRLAPYSYDLIDNFGQRSPQQLTPGADDLHVGDLMVTIFRVVDVRPGRDWTGTIEPSAARLFGPLALTYAAVPIDTGSSRLICRIALPRPHGVFRLRATALAWGDLIMMRKQLANLKRLAERDAEIRVAGRAVR